jgi:hypothetical protein
VPYSREVPQKARTLSCWLCIESDMVIRLLQAMHIWPGEPVGGQAITMLRTESLMRHAIPQHVVHRDHDAVPDRQGGLLLGATTAKPGILGSQIRSSGATRCPTTLDHQRLQPRVPFTCLPRLPLAATLVLPQTDSGSRGQMGCG